MNPYDRAAFGFAKAYQMNMRAADEQRRANQPSSSAFAEGLADEKVDYRHSSGPHAPVPPSEPYTGRWTEDGVVLDRSNGNSVSRAKQKVSKYLRRRG